MQNLSIAPLLAIFAIFFPTILLGQACCSGGVPVSSNLGLPVGAANTVQWSLSYDYNALNTLKTGSITQQSQERERSTQSVLLELGYSLNNRFSIDGFFAYLQQDRFIRQSDDLTRTRGIGDAVLLFKYNVFAKDFSSLTLGVGPKIPLGATDHLSNNSPIPPALDLQSGSGAWDLLFWTQWSTSLSFRPSMSWISTAIYSYRGVYDEYQCQNGSCQTYQFGQDVQLMSGLSDRIFLNNSIFDASLLFRYRFVTEDLFNDAPRPGTGGNFLLISTGISYWITSDFSLNATFELPLYSNVKDTQVAPTFRLNFGVFHRLELGKNQANSVIKI
ncbi:MAG: hypothetical protein AAF849_16900 [Bacteroidota bacterium]